MVEGMILSTCNRVEVAVTAEESSRRRESVESFLAEARSVERAWVSPYLYHYDGSDAIRHLFRVASSLDSMVVGEPQILGQLKIGLRAREGARRGQRIPGPGDDARVQRRQARAHGNRNRIERGVGELRGRGTGARYFRHRWKASASCWWARGRWPNPPRVICAAPASRKFW